MSFLILPNAPGDLEGLEYGKRGPLHKDCFPWQELPLHWLPSPALRLLQEGPWAPQTSCVCEGLRGNGGKDLSPLPLLCTSSPLFSPLSPSNKLPCGQIWFNFLRPLKGNETSGRDLKESKREDVNDGDLAQSCSCGPPCWRQWGRVYLPFSPVCVRVRISVYTHGRTVGVYVCVIAWQSVCREVFVCPGTYLCACVHLWVQCGHRCIAQRGSPSASVC